MTISLLNSLDELFAGVVMAPGDWSDQRIGEWMSGIDAESADREAIKILNRGVRRATRLRKYWLQQTKGPQDWQQRVDQALGGEGWRVSLDLALWSLKASPDPGVFAVMTERFRWVKFQPFPQSYDEWLNGQYSTERHNTEGPE